MERLEAETRIHAPVALVWDALTTPEDICAWNAALDSWHTPRSEVDLREGGRFNHRMEAKNGSMGFDLTGTFTAVEPGRRLEYRLDDGRMVEVRLSEVGGHTHVHESFEPEGMNPHEMQRQGWQAILDNFRRHVEARHSVAT